MVEETALDLVAAENQRLRDENEAMRAQVGDLLVAFRMIQAACGEARKMGEAIRAVPGIYKSKTPA